MSVTVQDLPALGERPELFLYCEECDERYSATRGDYFWMPPSEPFTCECCDAPLVLARAFTRVEVASPLGHLTRRNAPKRPFGGVVSRPH